MNFESGGNKKTYISRVNCLGVNCLGVSQCKLAS